MNRRQQTIGSSTEYLVGSHTLAIISSWRARAGYCSPRPCTWPCALVESKKLLQLRLTWCDLQHGVHYCCCSPANTRCYLLCLAKSVFLLTPEGSSTRHGKCQCNGPDELSWKEARKMSARELSWHEKYIIILLLAVVILLCSVTNGWREVKGSIHNRTRSKNRYLRRRRRTPLGGGG